MKCIEAIRIIEESGLFKRDTRVYIKDTDYIIDMLVDGAYKYYNILLIQIKEDEMRLFSPLFYDENLKPFKFSKMKTFRLIGSVF